MESMIYYRLAFVLSLTCVHGQNVSINKDPTGQEGSNGTYIECSFDMNGILVVDEVTISAYVNGTMTPLVIFFSGGTYITPSGEYLRGRVTYSSIASMSNRTVLYFEQLLCEDDTEYQCRLMYIPDPFGPSHQTFSNRTHLTVTIFPLRPVELTIYNSNKTYDTDGLGNLTFVEGDNITATCSGEVGKPPANLTMQIIRRNGTAYNITLDNNSDIIEMANCSFYQNNSFTTTLAEDDNGSTLRCAVGYSDTMFIESGHITVLFPVHVPVITSYPSRANNLPPLTLHCQSRGNPEPDYAWFKLSPTENFKLYASSQSITLHSISDSGVYRCEVNNSIGQILYNASRNIMVVFEVMTTTEDIVFTTARDMPNTQTQTMSTVFTTTQGNPSTVGNCVERICTCKQVPGILGAVFGTLSFCVVISVIVCLWQKRSIEKLDEGHQMSTLAHENSSSTYEGISTERTDHQYEDLKQIRQHTYYNTQIQPTR